MHNPINLLFNRTYVVHFVSVALQQYSPDARYNLLEVLSTTASYNRTAYIYSATQCNRICLFAQQSDQPISNSNVQLNPIKNE